MLKQLSKFASMALIAGSLSIVSVPTAFAANATPERAGYSAASAAMPTAGNHQLQPGQWDWYVFHPQIPVNQSRNDKGKFDGSTVDATMNLISGQGKFVVWSGDNLRDWTQNDKFNAMGEGTQVFVKNTTNHDTHDRNLTNNSHDDMVGTSTYSWQGNFQQPGTYYLIVENTGSTPMNYTLTVSGNSVIFPSAMTIPAQ
ncbi:MAG: hypothetical protein KDE58_11830 [Caldilineaceae bacterium]|nr:hypothetical protein [Caldilineaceae bacterium]